MLFPILVFILIVFLFFVRIKQINEYEKGILFKFGKFTKELGAGWHFYVPLYQNITKVDTRTTVHDVPEQDAITKDNVSIKINAVVYYHVSDAKLTVLKVENVRYAVGQISQTTMRNIVGAYTLDELLSERDEISTKICGIIDQETDAWGIKVENVELKDIRLPEEMQRVLAKVAEAEREKAAVITKSKETVIRNGEVIKDEEKVEQKIYDDNNKKLESEPQVFKRTEENQQAEGRYKGVDSQVEEEHKNEYGNWFLKHSMNKDGETKVEEKKEPQEEFQRNEMGYKTWFENNSEGGSVAVNNSSEVKQHGDNAYDDWFKRHSKPNMIIQYKPEVKKDENIVRYEGDYQTWFENHSKLTNNKI